MPDLVFQKLIAFDSLPGDWGLVKIAVDWAGLPLLLMAEGRPPRPDPSAGAEAWSRWNRTPPKALHIVFLEGDAVKTIRITQGIGELALHVQPYDDGWILGYSRTGRANLYDCAGSLLHTLNLGDAIEDLQTVPDGKIWVSYFDEGVYGEGISTQGLVCFDRSGTPLFRYRDNTALQKLPPIDDCYALNVGLNGDVWVNYYMDFPLVLLRNMEVNQHWLEFGSLGNAFAVHGDSFVYLRNSNLMARSLDLAAAPEEVHCADADGNRLTPSPIRHLAGAARGNHLALNAGNAIYMAAL
jgi:hypothetical protein